MIVCAKPTNVPTMMPAKKPLNVLWAPSIGLPSEKFLPKSIGGPPPKITGAALAQYAGKMNHIAAAMSSIVIMLPPYLRLG
jgi:hypothetical protein